jgi:hypothetical protein
MKVVKAVGALAVWPAHAACLEALAILLLALGVLARAPLFLCWRLRLAGSLPHISPLLRVRTVHAPATIRIASHPILQAVAVSLSTVISMTVAFNLPFIEWDD